MFKPLALFKRQSRYHFTKLFSTQEPHTHSSNQQDLKDYHQVKHSKFILDPKFYKDDIEPTLVQEIEFIRSPFYDLAKDSQLTEDTADKLLDHVAIKSTMMEKMKGVNTEAPPSQNDIAYPRYADNLSKEENAHLFKPPRATAYRRINNAELFRIQKPDNHNEVLKRQKSFLAQQFYPPFDLREQNLKELFEKHQEGLSRWVNKENIESDQDFDEFKVKLIEIIPKLNHDILIQLALHMAFDAKVNDFGIWRSIEEAAVEALHQLSITQISQLEWAVQELKPKRSSQRLNDILINKAIDGALKCKREELMCLMQGFRKRQNTQLYQKVRQALIKNKNVYFPDKNKEERAKNLANMFISLASNKPKKFGVYQKYYEEELNELIGLYEEDFKEAIMDMDEEHLTRMAQALYILKTPEYDNLWQRVERRALELKDKLDHYHLCNLIRSFSRSQNNSMCASDKTYYKLEEKVLKNLDKYDSRDLTHLMYSYSVRGVGNPELYANFDQKLNQVVEKLDYPSMFNAIYYMLFTNNSDQQLWDKVIQTTIKNKDILPIIYYRPFKASKFYLKHKFPQMDITDYTDKFWYAERYFNVHLLEGYITDDVKYMDFKKFLTNKLLIYPLMFVPKNNLFILHYSFEEHKIAINYHLKKFVPDARKEPTEMQKLPAKIMKLDNWEVLDLTETQFDDWKYEEKIENLKGWLLEAKQRQIKNGVIPEKPKVYV